MKKKKSTLQQAKEYVKYWVPRLRLLDWEVRIRITEDPKEIAGYAQAQHHANYQYVEICVLDPKYIPKDWLASPDLEVSVVHELLHTRLFHLPPLRKQQQYHEEMVIETLAVALVCARRGLAPKDLK